jgi:hypothetical protein
MNSNINLGKVVKDGNLFFFTSTLSAAAITSACRQLMKLLENNPSSTTNIQLQNVTCQIKTNINGAGLVWSVLASVILLLLYSIMYGGLNILKVIRGSNQSSLSASLPPPQEIFWTLELFLGFNRSCFCQCYS